MYFFSFFLVLIVSVEYLVCFLPCLSIILGIFGIYLILGNSWYFEVFNY